METTKSLLQSKTIWGLLAIAVPYVDHIYQYAANLPDGVLPQPVAIAVTGLGWLLAFYGRMTATKPISV